MQVGVVQSSWKSRLHVTQEAHSSTTAIAGLLLPDAFGCNRGRRALCKLTRHTVLGSCRNGGRDAMCRPMVCLGVDGGLANPRDVSAEGKEVSWRVFESFPAFFGMRPSYCFDAGRRDFIAPAPS